MDINELRLMQNYPLELKIMKTKLRIQEWVSYYGLDGVYISFSGGKDSTVLLHIARELYPNIKALYIDTGLEYPEVKQFVKTWDNVDIIRPKMSFKQVIEKYGYPVISKEQSQYIYQYRNAKSEKTKEPTPKAYQKVFDDNFRLFIIRRISHMNVFNYCF